jgi:hypothetical protein
MGVPVSTLQPSVLETEAAFEIGKLVRAAGYGLEVAPRAKGADLAASRDGTVWATFHLDVDGKHADALHVGATVWGGARSPGPPDLPRRGTLNGRLSAFVRDRLLLACKRGRAENPDHCSTCPDPTHAV